MKEFSREILDAFDDGLCLLENAGALRLMNKAAEELTGYRQNELAGRPFFDTLKVRGPLKPIDASRETWNDIEFRRKDGILSTATYTIRRLGVGDSSPVLFKFRKRRGEARSNAALDDIKSKLDAIFGAMSDGLIIIDKGGAIQFFTTGAEKLFGYRQDEVLGLNVKKLMPAPWRESHDGYLAAYANTGVKRIIGVGREVRGLRKDGSTFPMYLSVGEISLQGQRFFVGVAHDLTRLNLAEERLLTISAAVDQSPAAVVISTKDGRIEYVNRRFSELTGHRADELVGLDQQLLRMQSKTSPQLQHIWDIIATGKEWRGEIQGRKKNGELYWALESVTPLRGAHGEVTHYLTIQQDVTEQKRHKEALAESERRFRHVAEMAGEWLWEQDLHGRYIYCSGAVRNILGFAPDEIIGKSYLDLLVNDEKRAAAQSSFATGNSRPFHRLVNHYRHRDGHTVYTESTGAPIFDESGRLLKWRGVDHDITAHKLFEDALRVRDRAIESAPVGIVICDARTPGYPSIYVNPALTHITGYPRDELLGESMRMLQGPETDVTAVEQIRRAIANRQSCEVTLKNYRKSGAMFWNELIISPVVDEQGVITHFIGIQTDVTERRRAEESRHELEIAKHIQLSLLPEAPLRLPHVELAGLCLPASQVGGDYFDYFQNSGVVDVVIADVSGHSVGAALIMTEVRSALRAETRKAHSGAGPAQVLRDLNELLHQDLTRAELFITMFYFRYYPETRTLRYANAGHNFALLLRAASDSCTLLDAEGLILGVKRVVDFEERSLDLATGDMLLFYTDGITEAQNRDGEFFGVGRLCAALRTHRHLASEFLINKLLAEVRAFCGESPPSDDIAMVIMRVT